MWCTRCGEEVEDRATHASVCAGASAAARPGAPPPPVMPPNPPSPGPVHRPPPADPPYPPPFQSGGFPPASPEREHVRRAWRNADSPLVSVTARHSQYQVEDITVEVRADGRLTVTDGAAHVRPGSGFGGQAPTTSAGSSADAALWALAEQVALGPPPDPPGPPPPGSPGESLVLRRADGREWAITCTPGAVVHSPEQAAADELLARVIGQGRETVGRDPVRWRGPGPEPIRRPDTDDTRPPWLPPSTDPTATTGPKRPLAPPPPPSPSPPPPPPPPPPG